MARFFFLNSDREKHVNRAKCSGNKKPPGNGVARLLREERRQMFVRAHSNAPLSLIALRLEMLRVEPMNIILTKLYKGECKLNFVLFSYLFDFLVFLLFFFEDATGFELLHPSVKEKCNDSLNNQKIMSFEDSGYMGSTAIDLFMENYRTKLFGLFGTVAIFYYIVFDKNI